MNKIQAALAQHAQTLATQVALQSAQQAMTYAELYAAVNRLSEWLAAQALSRVALWGENSLQWIIADLAAWQAGISVIPVPPFFSAAQRQHLLTQAQVTHVLVCGAMPSIAPVSQRSVTPQADIYLDTLSVNPVVENPAPVTRAGIAKITFTSGTTGAPKGVCLSSAALENVTLALAERIYVEPSHAQAIQRHLVLLPLSTLLENIAGVYLPLYLGKTIYVFTGAELGFTGSSNLALPQLLQKMHECQPNSVILLPQILQGLVAAKAQGYALPESLKFIAVGGAKTSPALIAQARALGLPVYEGYGLSECASVVSLNAPGADKPGSVGKPLGHVQVRIQNGIIFTRGNAFSGYLHQPQATDEWVNTGDLGELDSDGFLFITGRVKNLLISSFGRNISPEWVEAELMLSPHIAQAMLLGDAQAFCSAIVVPRNAQQPALLLADVARINQTLPDYAQVKKIIIATESFTAANEFLTANGRLRREAIAAHYNPAITAIYSQHQPSANAGVVYDIL